MTFPDHVNDKQWIQEARTLLNKSRVQFGYHRYTQPSPDTTGQQSPWASALYALLYRWFDTEMAADELKSAVAKQLQEGPNAGLIPARVPWRGGDQTPSNETAPPLLAFATVQVYHFSGDTNLLERVYPRLVAWHEWLRRQDNNPPVLVNRPDDPTLGSGAMDLNAIRAADLDALGHLALDMGNQTEAARREQEAEVVRAARRRQPLDLSQGVHATHLMGLFGRILTSEEASQLVERVLGQPNEGKRFPWLAGSGEVISMVDSWLIYMGLRRYGFSALASGVAERSFRLVEQNGFHPFYDPITGHGIGAPDFGLSALALDMLFREKSGIAPKPQCIQDVD